MVVLTAWLRQKALRTQGSILQSGEAPADGWQKPTINCVSAYNSSVQNAVAANGTMYVPLESRTIRSFGTSSGGFAW